MLLEKSVSLVTTATRGASWLCSLRNQLCVCVCLYYLGLLICKREGRSMRASVRNDFRAFGFNVACLHLLSVSSFATIGPLSVDHTPQFLSSKRHIHTQTANKTPLCLHCCAGRRFTKSCTLWLYRNTVTRSSL